MPVRHSSPATALDSCSRFGQSFASEVANFASLEFLSSRALDISYLDTKSSCYVPKTLTGADHNPTSVQRREPPLAILSADVAYFVTRRWAVVRALAGFSTLDYVQLRESARIPFAEIDLVVATAPRIENDPPACPIPPAHRNNAAIIGAQILLTQCFDFRLLTGLRAG